MEGFALQYGYPGVFIISLIGSSSIVVPVPYTVALYFLGHFLDPLLVALAAGLGAALGEFTGYVIGYYGRTVISKERQRKMDFMMQLCNRYGGLVIFLFALTPLPDDLLFIPLGIIRCSFTKFFIPCFLGKTLMSYILAVSGQMSITFIMNLFGEGNEMYSIIVTAVLLAVVIVAMLKIDWEKLFLEKVEKNERKSKDKTGA